jgi:carbon starvation protein
VGYWTQHFAYRAAERSGKTSFGSAADAQQLHDVVRNTFIQGSLSIVFASLVAVVFVTGLVVSLKAIRGSAPTTEAAPVLSRRFAPAGLVASAVEREVQAQWDARQAG